MGIMTYDPPITALTVVDPYNDFISEGGKEWDRLKPVAEANNSVRHMQQVLNAARPRTLGSSMRCITDIPGDYATWNHIAPTQRAAWSARIFEDGTWGGEIRAEFAPLPGDVVALEYWCSSGFANTDLDLLLKKHGVRKLIVIGLIATTCGDSTVRCAAKLSYDVTMVRDASAGFSDEDMQAAFDINIPNYADVIVTANELVRAIAPANV